ncbi:MAG: rhodanese-like domain-containing protein [Desulfobacteraceae bacterium]
MKTKRIFVPLIALLLFAVTIAGCSTSTTAPGPTAEPDWHFHDIVDVAFVAQYAKVPMAKNVMIIDARPKRAKYDKGHIPMAVSMPDSQFEKMSDRLPGDKEALLIFYCGGFKCKLSHKSARKAEALGYKNVKVFAAGFPGWMAVKGHYASVSVDYVKKQIDKNADMVLVDARPKRTKYDKGHIPTAISIPDSQFEKLSDRLPKDKDKLIVFYCGGYKCKLSHKSAAKALAMGYTHVKVFSAGYPAWKTVLASSAPVQVKKGEEEGSIDIDTFKKIMAENPTDILLIDVRDKDEFQTGSLRTAINIPVDELEGKIKSLPTDRPVIFICGTGARSGESFYMVQDLRPGMKNVYYLDAEMTVYEDGRFELKKPAG